MDTTNLVPQAIALGICFAVAKYVPNQMVKAGAYGVMGLIVAKNVPFVKDALA